MRSRKTKALVQTLLESCHAVKDIYLIEIVECQSGLDSKDRRSRAAEEEELVHAGGCEPEKGPSRAGHCARYFGPLVGGKLESVQRPGKPCISKNAG